MTAKNISTATQIAAPELTVNHGQPVVTSRQIAEDFAKSHFNVIRDIEEAAFSDEFRAANFQTSSYSIEGQTRQYKQYLLTRDGFTIIAMGYDGQKAMAFKEAYIAAFNQMEKALAGDVPIISAMQLQTIREQVANCTRYLHHKNQSFAQTLYLQMKNDIGYQKIEQLPQAKYQAVLDYIKHHEPITREVWKISTFLEREFIRHMKSHVKPKKEDVAGILIAYQSRLGQSA